jgi:hypothetical protein
MRSINHKTHAYPLRYLYLTQHSPSSNDRQKHSKGSEANEKTGGGGKSKQKPSQTNQRSIQNKRANKVQYGQNNALFSLLPTDFHYGRAIRSRVAKSGEGGRL